MLERGTLWNIGKNGYIRFLDHMGSDDFIAEAARTSYQSGTKRVTENEGLLRRLMRDRHTSPFEMAEIVIEMQLPIYVMRQWVRHRTANMNEMSLRYSQALDIFHEFGPEDWRLQDSVNKQGSDGQIPADRGEFASEAQKEFHKAAIHLYEQRRRLGIAREQARVDLPVSNMTRVYWKCDLHNLLHFLALRLHPHAQKEIRDYAEIIATNIVQPLFPITYRAFCDYRLNAITLSALEIAAIQSGDFTGETTAMGKSELAAFQDKMKMLRLK